MTTTLLNKVTKFNNFNNGSYCHNYDSISRSSLYQEPAGSTVETLADFKRNGSIDSI